MRWLGGVSGFRRQKLFDRPIVQKTQPLTRIELVGWCQNPEVVLGLLICNLDGVIFVEQNQAMRHRIEYLLETMSVLAFALFHEKGRAVRITGTVLITAGLILIGLLGK